MEKEVYNPQIDEFINEEEEELHKEVEKEEHKHPLQALVDFYKDMVKEKDELGFADIFKRETERFLTKLDAHLKEFYELSLTPEDIQYEDGYFLFGHGTNSVVSFHAKEAPGWLFGIWWSPKEIIETRREGEPVRYENDCLRCEFFAQYEETIDKFKPTASMFVEEFDWEFEKPGEEENLWRLCFDACRAIRLILQYPYVAFVRELRWSDLNVDYISPEDAEQFYTEWRLKDNAKKLMRQENEKAMLDCLNYIFEPIIKSGDAFIADRPFISPRYELIMRNVWKDDQGQEESQDGCYSLFDFGADWPDKKEDEELWNKTRKECEERAKALDDWWSCPVSYTVIILSGEKYWDYKKKMEELKND